MTMSSASICSTVVALKGYWEVMLRLMVLQRTPRWDPSSFSSTAANREMADGGSRHASGHPKPPYGWNVGMMYLQCTDQPSTGLKKQSPPLSSNAKAPGRM